jgi:hypothetical protein
MREMPTEFLLENIKERDYLGDLGISMRATLN